MSAPTPGHTLRNTARGLSLTAAWLAPRFYNPGGWAAGKAVRQVLDSIRSARSRCAGSNRRQIAIRFLAEKNLLRQNQFQCAESCVGRRATWVGAQARRRYWSQLERGSHIDPAY